MVNFGPLAAEIGLFRAPEQISTGFGSMASLLHRRPSTEVNQTLHDVWQSSWTVQWAYVNLRGSCSLTEFNQVQTSLSVQLFRSPIFAALLHGTRVVGVSQTLRRSAEGAIYVFSMQRCRYAH